MHYCVQKLRKPAVIALAGFTLTVCGGKDSRSPSQPSVPVASATATPIAAPTPQPPVSASCAKLPPAAVNYTCRTEHASFMKQLNEAIDTVKSEHPEAFDGEYVKNVGLYIVEVIKAFDKIGICADFDGEELGVATSHNFNDQYDILTARSEVRRYFVGSCYPSVGPVSRKLGGIPGGCNLLRAGRSPAETRHPSTRAPWPARSTSSSRRSLSSSTSTTWPKGPNGLA